MNVMIERESTGLATRIALWGIEIYQREISPRKGYLCAHRVLHGGESCSEFGHRAFRTVGVIGAIRSLRSRFRECRAAAAFLAARRFEERLAEEAEAKRKRLDELEGPNPHWYEASSFCCGDSADLLACCSRW